MRAQEAELGYQELHTALQQLEQACIAFDHENAATDSNARAGVPATSAALRTLFGNDPL